MSKDDIQWAVDCWFQQVSNRPIKNIHRRTLDDTWRMVIRRLGGDDIALIGPSHDGSLAAQNIIRSNYEWETSNSEDEITRLRAELTKAEQIIAAYELVSVQRGADLHAAITRANHAEADLAVVTEERDRMRALLVCLYDAAGPLDADKMPADDFAQIITIVLDARAALEGVTEPASPWRDIESAPRDGTPILCVKKGDGFQPEILHFEAGVFGWLTDDMGFGCHPNRQPTHWMPLPEPPR